MGYADDTTICVVIPRLLSGPQVMKSKNRHLTAIHSCCLKWYTRLNPRKTKSRMISRSRTYAPGYGDLALGGEELEELIRVCVFLGYPLTLS